MELLKSDVNSPCEVVVAVHGDPARYIPLRMKSTLVLSLVLFLMASLFSGCGTLFTQTEYLKIHNKVDTRSSEENCHIPQLHIYSGTLFDARMVLAPCICKLSGESGLAFMIVYPLLLIGGIIDMPLSFIADTAILPYTVCQEIIHSTDIYDDIFDIWGTSSRDVYFAGEKGGLHHFDGVKWRRISINTDDDLKKIWGFSKNDIYIITNKGAIFHFDGMKWSLEIQKKFKAYEDFKSILTFPDRKALALNQDRSILYFDGSHWNSWKNIKYEQFDLHYMEMRSMWGNSFDNLYFTALAHEEQNSMSNHDMTRRNRTKIVHYDGKEFFLMDIYNKDYLLADIFGFSDSDIFIVGNHDSIFHFDGKKWDKMKIEKKSWMIEKWILKHVGDMEPANYKVKDDGSVLHLESGEWKEKEIRVSGEKTDRDLLKMWGTSHSNVYAVGCDGLIIHYDGSSWKEMEINTNDYLITIWGSSEKDIYAAGINGTILHYDGKDWKME